MIAPGARLEAREEELVARAAALDDGLRRADHLADVRAQAPRVAEDEPVVDRHFLAREEFDLLLDAVLEDAELFAPRVRHGGRARVRHADVEIDEVGFDDESLVRLGDHARRLRRAARALCGRARPREGCREECAGGGESCGEAHHVSGSCGAERGECRRNFVRRAN
ncbi:MAG: hypothetical protein LC785_16260 [Acidobacteria bacterium]|nr:hypothetical protein [Acidobacteriota bacterium]MCA1643457.1 hypothetical protein [Acidobacteriota bacterium]